MKACEIVAPYFEAIGLHLTNGDARSMMPLGVFCMHDYMYQIFNRDIKGLKLKHEGKKFKNEWERENTLQFRRFFLSLDEERKNIIIDIMDDFEGYVSSSIDLIRFCIMDCVNDVPLEEQKIIASLQVCNIMAQVAQNVWVSMVKTTPMLSNKLRYNEIVRKYSALLSDGIYVAAGGKHVNEKHEKRLNGCIQSFCNKLIDWVNSRSKDEIEL